LREQSCESKGNGTETTQPFDYEELRVKQKTLNKCERGSKGIDETANLAGASLVEGA